MPDAEEAKKIIQKALHNEFDLGNSGDLDGYAVWRRVLRAVEELMRVELTEGERLN